MLDFMPAIKGASRMSGQGHRLRLCFSNTTGLCVCVYLSTPQSGQFTVLQLVAAENNRYSLEHVSTLFTTQVINRPQSVDPCAPDVCIPAQSLHPVTNNVTSCLPHQETIVDFQLTATDIWALWVDQSNAAVVKYINFEQYVGHMTQRLTSDLVIYVTVLDLMCVFVFFCSNSAAQWNQVFVQPPPDEEVHVGVDQDPRVRPHSTQGHTVNTQTHLAVTVLCVCVFISGDLPGSPLFSCEVLRCSHSEGSAGENTTSSWLLMLVQ